MDESLLATHVDAVHAVPRDEFVAERDRRVRELRQEGHREEAATLKGQRKPTVPAWVVNQLARREADAVERLVEAGGALRTAQVRAASGKGADDLRTASRRVRDLATDLAVRARAVLEDAGAGPGHLDEVQQTLFAAATDPDLQETLCRGVFTRPVEAAGFGVIASLAAVPEETTPATDGDGDRDPDGPDTIDEQDAAAREQQRRQEEAAALREARRRTLERQRGELRQSLVRQQRRVERARTRADDLQARADAAAADARQEQDDHDRIQAELDQVDEELAGIEDTEADALTS